MNNTVIHLTENLNLLYAFICKENGCHSNQPYFKCVCRRVEIHVFIAAYGMFVFTCRKVNQ